MIYQKQQLAYNTVKRVVIATIWLELNYPKICGIHKIMMILIVLIVCIIPYTSQGFQIYKKDFSEKMLFNNGSTYIFTSVMDHSVITVHSNGEVTTEVFRNAPEQRWRVVPHPFDSNALEFKQDVVPYNTLSGYEDPVENPGLFPRPLGLASRGPAGNIETWNILIRGRWCIQANGFGYQMDMDDCEDFTAPWQLWQLEEIS